MQMTETNSIGVLPTTIKPISYVLALKPDLETEIFEGTVDIQLQVFEPTSKIKLNLVQLEIQAASLTNEDGQRSELLWSLEEENETVTFVSSKLLEGLQTLSITYRGVFNKNMAGFYLSTYKTSSGEIKKLATTQFEPADARRAFPCFDEPLLKATFEISVELPLNLSVLSNMDVKSEEVGKLTKKVAFNPTPLVSTYLIAFILGEFEMIESTTKDAVPVRCFTTEGQIENSRYALSVATKCLEYFVEIFGLPYSLPKLDLIGIPDFAAGAMENWGLVTYRLTAMLYEEGRSSVAAKQRVAYVVCHELAHQWFGNLVTMKWWSDLWLNEGFATWAGWLAVDHIHPEWDIWTLFVSDDYARALSLDCMHSTHPIQVPVSSPGQISEIFDAISYSKGASVIRMLAAYLGEDIFLQGIRGYLKRYVYSNAETEDLWSALSKASGKDVSKLMREWTLKAGHPVLDVSFLEGKLHVKQERFCPGEVSDETIWSVPMHVLTEKGEQAVFEDGLLANKEDTTQFSFEEFLKINSGQTGLFRVRYSNDLLENLFSQCQKGGLSAADRLGLVSDLATLARLGKESLANVLKLITALKEEKNPFVWTKMISTLKWILHLFQEQDPAVLAQFKRFCAWFIRNKINQVGTTYTPGEDETLQLLRADLVTFACEIDYLDIIGFCLECFSKFFKGEETAIHPNILRCVLENGLKKEGRPGYTKVFAYYQQLDLAPDRKIAALSALGGCAESEIADEVLMMTLDESPTALVRGQDVVFLIASVARNPATHKKLLPFMQRNWDQYRKRFVGSSNNLLKHLLSSFSTAITLRKDVDAFITFFETRPKDGIEMALAQAVEAMAINADFIEKNANNLAEWLMEGGF